MTDRRRVGKTRAHQQYRLKDGTRVKGCTTYLGVLDKSRYLVPWANRLGLQGIDSSKHRDVMAETGTLLHAMVEADIGGYELDTDEFSRDQISSAENAFIKYLEWREQHTLDPIGTELQMVSEKYRYGGTADLVCRLDGNPLLVDIKTAKAIYDENSIQLAALRQLLHENGYEIGPPHVGQAILRVGRDEREGFEFRVMPLLPEHWELFLTAKRAYELREYLFGRG